jgi:hypothetical protein
MLLVDLLDTYCYQLRFNMAANGIDPMSIDPDDEDIGSDIDEEQEAYLSYSLRAVVQQSVVFRSMTPLVGCFVASIRQRPIANSFAKRNERKPKNKFKATPMRTRTTMRMSM